MDGRTRNRALLASVLAIPAMQRAMDETADILGTAQDAGLIPRPKRDGGKRREWTCRKCGEKFHPGMSPTLCNNCIRERDGGRRR